ncbi:hypothetical protein D9613_005863 [Agrocybe pediades]|uniref:AB hydrolase-1 domain-containing protein n=1 Tax=Agrocybe pediades TaxID=84607 RepID=A0A8H4QTY0_9AGAR|nr:hypothetical protein D9613_005863 [Agrocybe pediades]
MPKVEINSSSSGPALINYTLSTPGLPNAHISQLDPTLPTVLFLHAVYIGHPFFHRQFSDPNLRRFNLIAFDARCHGLSIGNIPPNFREKDAAEDVFRFMEALNLPQCHLFGVSSGASIALRTAIRYPESVASVYLLSPLPSVEPEIVAEGRQEIYDNWVEANKDPDNVDEEALLDSILGALHLGFNKSEEPLVHTLVASTTPKAQINWAKQHFREFHTVSVDFFTDRKDYSVEDLMRLRRMRTTPRPSPPSLPIDDKLSQSLSSLEITSSQKGSKFDDDEDEDENPIPVHIVHCAEDIAYPLHFAEALRDRLINEAGLPRDKVKLTQIPGAPHLGCVTHPEPINASIHEWVLSNTPNAASIVPPAKPAQNVHSPFEEELTKYGLHDKKKVQVMVLPGTVVVEEVDEEEEDDLIPLTPINPLN